MKGLSLATFRLDLVKIDPDSETPADSIRGWQEKLAPHLERINRWWGAVNLATEYHRLPLDMLEGFSFDELCKLHHSSVIMMNKSVTDLFETKAQYEIVRKIKNSMWRWSCGRGTWNQVVDAYDNIRRFKFLADPNFEIRLDHSTWFNECGYSKYSRVYLDGTFGFLVYYKRVHVMTIGFSILEGRKLLIQQVQSAQRSGNRWLYKLPKQNRMEFVIDLFRQNFPGYTLFVIDGEALVQKILQDYRNALERAKESCERWSAHASMSEAIPRWQEDCRELERRITHLEADGPRLAAFYRNVGRYRFGKQPLTVHNLLHHRINVSPVKKSRLSSFLKNFGHAA